MPVEIGYIIRGEFVEFYVKDMGIGIAEEDQQLIFERFRQLNTSGSELNRGTGLGLAISKSLVELMGGRIWVESELGKGARFAFTIPFSPLV